MTILKNDEFNLAVNILFNNDIKSVTSLGLSNLLEDLSRFGSKPSKHFNLNDDLLDMLCGISPDPINKEILRRVMADPNGWTLNESDIVKEGSEFYARLGTLLKPDVMANVVRYHTIRDNLCELQTTLGLSSLKGCKTVTVLGESITIGDFDDQMTTTTQDKIQLQYDARRICDLFLNQLNGQSEYDLFEVLDDESYRETTLGKILSMSQNLNSAFLYNESHDWIRQDNGCWRGVACDRNPDTDPDLITIYLTNQSDLSITFKAIHSDKARFPWK